ncbi:MAG: hypothetical protein QOD69_198 [Solirubrobacteraceae bacterium]|nr:hypothetical protein [Solirubrobacteraceae bacterium]
MPGSAGARRRAAALSVLGAVLCAPALAPAAARAACSAPVPQGPDLVVTCPFTGAEQTTTIPPGAGALHVVAVGGRGQGPFGFAVGAVARATLAVGPAGLASGSVLYVEVGGIGDPVVAGGAGRGGFNGGGDGGNSGFVGGGGGGGASDVRTCSIAVCSVSGVPATDPRLIVAGGGGGTGAGNVRRGGDAGLPSPGGGGIPYAETQGGGGASSSAGGTGGASAGGSGSAGAAGVGGAGGSSLGGGGGGGGGFFGGGGGGGNGDGNGAGGGGGSSYAAPAATAVTFSNVGANGPPQVTITASPGPPVLAVAPSTLAFGEQDVDAGPTAIQTSTVSNPGITPVTLTAISPGGADAAPFERLSGLDTDCTATATLTVGGTCDLRVRFDPSAPGPRSATLTLASNAPEVAVALSGTGTAPPPAPPAPLAPPPAALRPASSLPLTCSGRSIVLVDVRRTGARVEVSGLARTIYGGRRASIAPVLAGRRGRAVRATIQRDGSFRTTLPLPAARDRATVRYQATIAGHRSAALKLVRQLVIVRRNPTAAGVRITAQVAGGRRQTVTITRQLSCTARRRVATVRTDRHGRFSVTLPRPGASGAIAYYRATTKRLHGPTFTLPIVVRA